MGEKETVRAGLIGAGAGMKGEELARERRRGRGEERGKRGR